MSECEITGFKIPQSKEQKMVAVDVVEKLFRAAKKLGLSCVNAGMYGPMKISPGECKCSTCEMREALAAYAKSTKDGES